MKNLNSIFSNLDKLIETQFMNDKELFHKVAEQMITDHRSLLKNIDVAISKKEWTELEKAAHKIKGALSIFGDSISIECSQRLEELGRKGSKSMGIAKKAEADFCLLQERVKKLCYYLKGTMYPSNKAA